MNIFSETVNKSVDESVLNVSGKKKNKRKSAQAVENADVMGKFRYLIVLTR